MTDLVADRVKLIVIDLLGVTHDQVTMSSRFREDLDADSLDLVELIMAFEEEFNFEISDEDGQKVTTIGGAVDLCKRLLHASGRPG